MTLIKSLIGPVPREQSESSVRHFAELQQMQGDTEFDLTWPREEPYTPRGEERERGVLGEPPPQPSEAAETLCLDLLVSC